MAFHDEKQEWDRFRDLMEIMEKSAQREPPEGFTKRVMAQLPERTAPGRRFSFRQPFAPRAFAATSTLGFRRPVPRVECAFYFFLTGFFYLVLGIVLLVGLQRPSELPRPLWLSIQPLFSLVFALGLTALGTVLSAGGPAAVRFVRFGTMLFALLVFLDGWMGVVWTPVPVGAFFAFIFSLTGLGMAFFLGMAVDRCIPDTLSSRRKRA